jgi:GDPmannose 4,6-dehydratase
MFGSSNEPLNENSPFKPVSPYSISKLAAHKICNSYRENFGLWISCGILFNHESELRPETFVFQKIITSALAISRKEASSMTLGNLEISRDWGYSKEYVEAMWLILQADNPKDYVVATGTSHSLRDLIELVFTNLQIKGSVDEFIKIDPSFTRPTDVESTVGDPRRIETDLGWKAKTSFEELVDILVRHQLKDSL